MLKYLTLLSWEFSANCSIFDGVSKNDGEPMIFSADHVCQIYPKFITTRQGLSYPSSYLSKVSLLQNPSFVEDLFAGFSELKGEQAAISGMMRFSSRTS